MPFMIGKAPIRRTLKYLEAGRLVLKDNISIFSINFNAKGDTHHGARDFVFWHLSQIQYKNPKVQIVTLRNMTPSPFIRCYYDDGRHMLIDIDNKPKEAVLEHLISVIGKTTKVLAEEAILAEKKDNPANFGIGCVKSCICEIPGQLTCPAMVPLPYEMRGKHKNPPN